MTKVQHDLMIVTVPHDITISEAYAEMRIMKKAVEQAAFKHIVLLFDGFSCDSRDLWDIPEARALAKTLNSIGFGSYLEVATFNNKDEDIRLKLGLYELWMIETGKFVPKWSHFQSNGVVAMLVKDANDKADRALGELMSPEKQPYQPSTN